jgi:hypothetical protein
MEGNRDLFEEKSRHLNSTPILTKNDLLVYPQLSIMKNTMNKPFEVIAVNYTQNV